MFMSRVKDMFSSGIPETVNREGYPAFERTLEEQYLQTLMTNTLGHTYYASSGELLIEARDLHDAMLKKDPEFAAKAMVFARNKGLMRLQPIWGLVKLSAVDKDLFKKVFDKVILIPSDLQDFFTILKGEGRGEGGRAIKRQAAKFLENVSEYWAIKYNGRGRGYSLGDIVRTVHPRPKSYKQNAIFAYLVGKDYDESLVPQIAAFEKLKRTTNVYEQVYLIEQGRLPWEVVTGVVKPTREIWEAILHQMPIFALLRNLNTFSRAGILNDNREYIESVFSDVDRIKKSKIMPFSFLKAYKQVEKGWVKNMLADAVEIALENVPQIPGNTAVFLDVSSSMMGDYIEIGSVFGIALYKKAGGNGVFWTFNTSVQEPIISLGGRTLDQAARIIACGGTDTSAPIKKLREDGIEVDNIIMITDEQQNTGSPFYWQLKKYREEINPDVKTFIIDVSPYRNYMTPLTDEKTYYIFGWSDTVLDYIAYTINGYGTMVDEVRNMKI